jgi:GDP-L-fucose synthase
MKTVLVTGGSGLVGQGIKSISLHFQNQLEFIFISSKQFDLTKSEQVEKMFETYKPNFIIHLAACVGGLFKNMNNKVEMLEKNLLLNYNVIHYSHVYKVEKLIACLSTCIFPNNILSYPVTEEMLHDGPPHSSNDAYAYAKRMIEIHCKAYRENFGYQFICVSPTNIYGPHDNFNLEDGHVLPVLIHRCFLAKQSKQKFIIRGTGAPLRQFIFSEDVGLAIVKILLTENVPDNIILSVPESQEISIAEVGNLIAKNFDYQDHIEFDNSYSDGQFKKTVSNKRLLTLFPDFKFVSVEDGIQRTIQWFLENKNIARI